MGVSAVTMPSKRGRVKAAAPFSRRVKPDLLFSRAGTDLAEVRVLDVRRLRIDTLRGFDVCPELQVLFVSDNTLVDCSGVESCRSLWRLDVSNNRLRSLKALCSFSCLGHLSICGNQIQSLGILLPLHRMHIIDLWIRRGNTTLIDKMPEWRYRFEVICIMPHVWVLDGQFITAAERAAAAEWAASPDGAGSSAARAVAAASGGDEREWIATASPPGAALLEVVAGEPLRQELRDAYRLKHLAQFYQADCELVNPVVRKRRVAAGLPGLLMPQIYLESLLALDPRVMTDLAVVLAAVAEHDVPRQVLVESLTVMLVGDLEQEQIEDIASLPHFCIAVVVFFLYELARARRDAAAGGAAGGSHTSRLSGSDAPSALEQQLWDALPCNGILGSSAFMAFDTSRRTAAKEAAAKDESSVDAGNDRDIESLLAETEEEVMARLGNSHDEGAAARLRGSHAVIILSRSPTFPSLVGTSALTGGAKATYQALRSLLSSAGMTEDDLTLDASPEAAALGYGMSSQADTLRASAIGRARGGPKGLPWNRSRDSAGSERTYSRPWAQDGKSTGETPASPAVRVPAAIVEQTSQLSAGGEQMAMAPGSADSGAPVGSAIPVAPSPPRVESPMPTSPPGDEAAGVHQQWSHPSADGFDPASGDGMHRSSSQAMMDWGVAHGMTALVEQVGDDAFGDAGGNGATVSVPPARPTKPKAGLIIDMDRVQYSGLQLGVGAGGGVYRIDLGGSGSSAFAGVRRPVAGQFVLVGVHRAVDAGTGVADPTSADHDLQVQTVFTTIVKAVGPEVVRLAPFAGCDLPPFSGELHVRTRALFWNPQADGFWRHVSSGGFSGQGGSLTATATGRATTGGLSATLPSASEPPQRAASMMLHRPHSGLARSGVSRAAGVPNMPVPARLVDEADRARIAKEMEATRRRLASTGGKTHNMAREAPPLAQAAHMAPLRCYTLNDTWDASFVLAPPALVEAQNIVAYNSGMIDGPTARGGGWARLTEVPFVLRADGATGVPASIDHSTPRGAARSGAGSAESDGVGEGALTATQEGADVVYRGSLVRTAVPSSPGATREMGPLSKGGSYQVRDVLAKRAPELAPRRSNVGPLVRAQLEADLEEKLADVSTDVPAGDHELERTVDTSGGMLSGPNSRPATQAGTVVDEDGKVHELHSRDTADSAMAETKGADASSVDGVAEGEQDGGVGSASTDARAAVDLPQGKEAEHAAARVQSLYRGGRDRARVRRMRMDREVEGAFTGDASDDEEDGGDSDARGRAVDSRRAVAGRPPRARSRAQDASNSTKRERDKASFFLTAFDHDHDRDTASVAESYVSNASSASSRSFSRSVRRTDPVGLFGALRVAPAGVGDDVVPLPQTDEEERAALQVGVVAPERTGDRTWYVVSDKPRFVVSEDPLPWRHQRTRPLPVPGRDDDDDADDFIDDVDGRTLPARRAAAAESASFRGSSYMPSQSLTTERGSVREGDAEVRQLGSSQATVKIPQTSLAEHSSTLSVDDAPPAGASERRRLPSQQPRPSARESGWGGDSSSAQGSAGGDAGLDTALAVQSKEMSVRDSSPARGGSPRGGASPPHLSKLAATAPTTAKSQAEAAGEPPGLHSSAGGPPNADTGVVLRSKEAALAPFGVSAPGKPGPAGAISPQPSAELLHPTAIAGSGLAPSRAQSADSEALFAEESGKGLRVQLARDSVGDVGPSLSVSITSLGEPSAQPESPNAREMPPGAAPGRPASAEGPDADAVSTAGRARSAGAPGSVVPSDAGVGAPLRGNEQLAPSFNDPRASRRGAPPSPGGVLGASNRPQFYHQQGPHHAAPGADELFVAPGSQGAVVTTPPTAMTPGLTGTSRARLGRVGPKSLPSSVLASSSAAYVLEPVSDASAVLVPPGFPAGRALHRPPHSPLSHGAGSGMAGWEAERSRSVGAAGRSSGSLQPIVGAPLPPPTGEEWQVGMQHSVSQPLPTLPSPGRNGGRLPARGKIRRGGPGSSVSSLGSARGGHHRRSGSRGSRGSRGRMAVPDVPMPVYRMATASELADRKATSRRMAANPGEAARQAAVEQERISRWRTTHSGTPGSTSGVIPPVPTGPAVGDSPPGSLPSSPLSRSYVSRPSSRGMGL